MDLTPVLVQLREGSAETKAALMLYVCVYTYICIYIYIYIYVYMYIGNVINKNIVKHMR